MNFDRLFQKAKDQGVTKAHLCRIAGKSAAYVHDLKNKGQEPPEDVVRLWADALHVSPSYLTGESDDPAPAEIQLTPWEQELLELCRSMNYQGREAVLATARTFSGMPQYRGEGDLDSKIKAPAKARA